MNLHPLPHADRRRADTDAALVLLHAHFDARSWSACAAAARALDAPERIDDEGSLLVGAALAVAQTYGLLDPTRDAAATGLARAAMAGGADDALDRSEPDVVLLWCTAAAEWCERNGLDHGFSRLAPRAAIADADPSVSTWMRVHWRTAAAWHHDAFGRNAARDRCLDEAQAIAEAGGDADLAALAGLVRARLGLWRNAPDAALGLAQAAAALADERHAPLRLADAADVAARVALNRGDMHGALHHARRAAGLGETGAAPPSYLMTYRLYEAYALLGLGAWDEAVALIGRLVALRLPAWLVERIELLARLFALARDDRVGPWSAASRAALAAVLRRLRELEWPGVLAVLPEVVTRLWARALEEDIETAWVRAAILSRDLAPPALAWPAAWPWAVRLRVLGPFSCMVGDLDLAAAPGKAAARPLALLRRIAAEGGHDSVAAETVALSLWPGEGREGRDKALETTLGRLRRLLGHADAVLLHERRLRLNPRRVWLDAAALARVIDAGPDERGWVEALALWRGVPLADEPAAPWLDDWRQRWRGRLAAALLADEAQPGNRARRLRAVAADPGLEALL